MSQSSCRGQRTSFRSLFSSFTLFEARFQRHFILQSSWLGSFWSRCISFLCLASNHRSAWITKACYCFCILHVGSGDLHSGLCGMHFHSHSKSLILYPRLATNSLCSLGWFKNPCQPSCHSLQSAGVSYYTRILLLCFVWDCSCAHVCVVGCDCGWGLEDNARCHTQECYPLPVMWISY